MFIPTTTSARHDKQGVRQQYNPESFFRSGRAVYFGRVVTFELCGFLLAHAICEKVTAHDREEGLPFLLSIAKSQIGAWAKSHQGHGDQI